MIFNFQTSLATMPTLLKKECLILAIKYKPMQLPCLPMAVKDWPISSQEVLVKI